MARPKKVKETNTNETITMTKKDFESLIAKYIETETKSAPINQLTINSLSAEYLTINHFSEKEDK